MATLLSGYTCPWAHRDRIRLVARQLRSWKPVPSCWLYCSTVIYAIITQNALILGSRQTWDCGWMTNKEVLESRRYIIAILLDNHMCCNPMCAHHDEISISLRRWLVGSVAEYDDMFIPIMLKTVDLLLSLGCKYWHVRTSLHPFSYITW